MLTISSGYDVTGNGIKVYTFNVCCVYCTARYAHSIVAYFYNASLPFLSLLRRQTCVMKEWLSVEVKLKASSKPLRAPGSS